MLNKIGFQNYKSFKDSQELELKPITVLIGKNSSGKSSIVKLLTLLDASIKGISSTPLYLKNKNVELGVEFRDLVYSRKAVGTHSTVSFKLETKNEKLEVTIGPDSLLEHGLTFFSWKLNNIEYIDEHNTQDFKGFISQNKELKEISFTTDYIGPFRKLPERGNHVNEECDSEDFGIHGENTYNFLIRDSFTKDKRLLENVSNWFKKSFGGWGVQVNSDTAPFYQIEITNEVSTINIKDVGQGMSQALPLVTRAFKKTIEETFILLEQPELHLHPAAHGDLAELFIDSINIDNNKKYLIETHSQNFLLRIRKLVVEKKISTEDVVFYFVDYDEDTKTSNLEKITINENGEVSSWPEGVFSESLEETLAIRQAQKEKK